MLPHEGDLPFVTQPNGKEVQAESAQQKNNSQYIGVNVGMVEGAGLCYEVVCTSVMCSGLVWVVTVQMNYGVLCSLRVNALCPTK